MEFNENKPIYLQLADKIMDEVLASPTRDDQRLPSVREYAIDSGVNPNTVNRTYVWLQEKGIIYNKRGIGYFFESNVKEKINNERKKFFLEVELPDFIKKWIKYEDDPAYIKNKYDEYLANLISV